MITKVDQIKTRLLNYLNYQERSKSTISQYVGSLQQVISAHKKRQLQYLDPKLIEDLETKSIELADLRDPTFRQSRRIRRFYRLLKLLIDDSIEFSEVAHSFDFTQDNLIKQFNQNQINNDGYYESLKFLNSFSDYLSSHEFSNDTIKSYRANCQSFLKDLLLRTHNSLNLINNNDILNAVKEYVNKRPHSYSKSLPAVRKFFNWLKDHNKVTSDFKTILTPRPPKYRPDIKYFTQEQIDLLLNKTDVLTYDGALLNTIISLAFYAGMRSIDMIKLNISDIDLHAGVISFKQSKTKKLVSLPLAQPLVKSIKHFLSVRPISDHQVLLLSKQHKPLTTRALRDLFANYRNNVLGVDFKGYGLHCFRRSLGTSLLQHDVDTALVAEILGHNSITSVDPYVKADFHHLKSCCLPLVGNIGRAELAHDK